MKRIMGFLTSGATDDEIREEAFYLGGWPCTYVQLVALGPNEPDTAEVHVNKHRPRDHWKVRRFIRNEHLRVT